MKKLRRHIGFKLIFNYMYNSYLKVKGKTKL